MAEAVTGWRPDPYGIHELRYFTFDGNPSRLVRDGETWLHDEPPDAGGPDIAPMPDRQPPMSIPPEVGSLSGASQPIEEPSTGSSDLPEDPNVVAEEPTMALNGTIRPSSQTLPSLQESAMTNTHARSGPLTDLSSFLPSDVLSSDPAPPELIALDPNPAVINTSTTTLPFAGAATLASAEQASQPASPEQGDDLSRLDAAARERIEGSLEDGEEIAVVIPGVVTSALVATNRRVLIFKSAMANGACSGEELHCWEYANVTGIELKMGATMGMVMVQVPGVAPVTKMRRMDRGPGSVSEAPNAILAQLESAMEDTVALLRDLVGNHQRPVRVPSASVPDAME